MKNLKLFLISAVLLTASPLFAKTPTVVLKDKPDDKLITCVHQGAALYVSDKAFKQASNLSADPGPTHFTAVLNGKNYEIHQQEDQNLLINVKGEQPVEYTCIFAVDTE